MIELKMITTREDLCKITGLSNELHYKELWENGFNLDDWDVCFASDVPLTKHCEDPEEESEWEAPIKETWWLVTRMENYCVGYEHVEYGGKHYYMVYHS